MIEIFTPEQVEENFLFQLKEIHKKWSSHQLWLFNLDYDKFRRFTNHGQEHLIESSTGFLKRIDALFGTGNWSYTYSYPLDIKSLKEEFFEVRQYLDRAPGWKIYAGSYHQLKNRVLSELKQRELKND